MKRFISQLFVLISLALIVLSCQKAPFVTMNTPRSFTFTRDGGTQNITFTCNRDWSVSSSESWISVSPASGTASDGEVTVKITCAANTTYDPRSATVTIKVEELTEAVSISQDTGLGLIVSPKTFELTNAKQTIEIEVQKNVQYSVAIDNESSAWIKQGGTKALTTDKVTFTIDANTSYDNREGKITFKQLDGSLAGTVKIKQAYGEGLFVEKSFYDIAHEGGSIEVDVKANVEYDVIPEVDWIHRVDTKALSNSTVSLSIDANTTTSYRTGTIVFNQNNGDLSQRITIKQQPHPLVQTLEADEVWFTNAGLLGMVEIEGEDISKLNVVFYYSKDVNTAEELVTDGIMRESYFNINDNSFRNYDIDYLVPATTYYYIACLNYNEKQYYGQVVSFTTKDITVNIETDDATSVKVHSGTISANLKIDAQVTPNVWFYYSETASSIEELVSTGTIANCDYGDYYHMPDHNYHFERSFKSELSSLKAETKYYYVFAVTFNHIPTYDDKLQYFGDVKTLTTKAVPDGAVDLGLSVCWAPCNLGATKPEEYGGYYAWGETETKSDYLWSTYKWGTSHTSLTKYNTDSSCGNVDNKTVLEPADDVANVKLGGKWRIPTDEEWKELVTKCTWTWTTNYNGTGVEGRIVTATNGNSIFLPLAGCRHALDITDFGVYWSSSLYTVSPASAWFFFFGSDRVDWSFFSRDRGQSVRPVTD